MEDSVQELRTENRLDFASANGLARWLHSMRTVVENLLKKQTGSMGSFISERERWQLTTFGFLCEHIHQRRRTKASGAVS